MTKTSTRTAPDELIFIDGKLLSDGSQVFDVRIGERVWPAVSQHDAEAMAEKIRAAIVAHTNLTVGVVLP